MKFNEIQLRICGIKYFDITLIFYLLINQMLKYFWEFFRDFSAIFKPRYSFFCYFTAAISESENAIKCNSIEFDDKFSLGGFRLRSLQEWPVVNRATNWQLIDNNDNSVKPHLAHYANDFINTIPSLWLLCNCQLLIDKLRPPLL